MPVSPDRESGRQGGGNTMNTELKQLAKDIVTGIFGAFGISFLIFLMLVIGG